MLAENLWANQINGYLTLVSISILYFDYLLTIRAEVEKFWSWPGGTLSWASVLFVINRYLLLIASVPIMFESFGVMPDSSCRKLQLYHQCLSVVTQIVVAVLLLMRTHALYNNDRRILLLLTVTICAGMASGAWSIFSGDGFWQPQVHPLSPHLHTCRISISAHQARHIAGAWGSVLAYDTLVFALTVIKALLAGNLWKGSLFRVMLRDGSIYFGIIILTHIANVVTFLRPEPQAKGICVSLTNVISSTLLTRLMLNLRDSRRGRTALGYLGSVSVNVDASV